MEGGFFVTSGTVRPDSASYVERRADAELFEALMAGEYCYVLDSRQKGKSSLMARTIVKLRQAGVLCVDLDLQGLGKNLDPEQWYAGLLDEIGGQLDLTPDLFRYWKTNQQFGPLRRWIGAIADVILPWLGERKLVIFIDEIDFVRSLPFDSDEFFAGIRGCYNRRTGEPAFSALSFCLLGSATPSDLIRDVRITPFNIGRRIELTDFTREEATPFAAALGRNGAVLLDRVLYWTGGHPYLTQRLCAAIAADPSIQGPGGVDRLVEDMFFSSRARTEEPNLADVGRRILETNIEGMSRDEYLASMLDLYHRVRGGKQVRDDESDPIVSILKLSGLARALEGYLIVRNRIYFRAFDSAWIKACMPDAEMKRQRSASRRAALRTSAIAGVIVVTMVGLAWNLNRALGAEKDAKERVIDLAEGYGMRVASEFVSRFDREGYRHLMETVPLRSRDLFAFRYDELVLSSKTKLVGKFGDRGYSIKLSPTAGAVLALSNDAIREIDYRTGRSHVLQEFSPQALSGDISWDQKSVAIDDGTSLKVIDITSGAVTANLPVPNVEDRVRRVRFSPDGSSVALTRGDKVLLLDLQKKKARNSFSILFPPIYDVAFSADGRLLAAVGGSIAAPTEGMGRLWNVGTGVKEHEMERFGLPASACAFDDAGTFIVGDIAGRLHSCDAARNYLETKNKQLLSDGVASILPLPNGSVAVYMIGHTVAVYDTGWNPTSFANTSSAVRSVTYDDSTGALVSLGTAGELEYFEPDKVANPAITSGNVATAIIPSGDESRLVKVGLVTGSVKDPEVAVCDSKLNRLYGIPLPPSEAYAIVRPSWNGAGFLLVYPDKRTEVQLFEGRDRVGSITLPASLIDATYLETGEIETIDAEGRVEIWDHRGHPLRTVLSVKSQVSSASFNKDGSSVAVTTPQGLFVVGLRGDGKRVSFRGLDAKNLEACLISPDGRWVAVRDSSAKQAFVGSTETGAVTSIEGTRDFAQSWSFSPDGRELLYTSASGDIDLIKSNTGRVLLTLKTQGDPTVNGSVWEDNGDRIVAVLSDGQYWQWRASPKQPAP